MNKTLLVMRNEIITAATRKSFMFIAFGLPLVALLVFTVVSALTDSSSDVGTGAPDTRETEAEGYVDQSGIIEFLPEDLPPGRLVAYPDDAAARQALEAGEISAYYIVPEDYVNTGQLIAIRPHYNPISPKDRSGWMRWVLLVNLLDGDVELASRIWNPMDLSVTTLAPESQDASDDHLYLFLMTTVVLFYALIVVSSEELLKSVSKEKENRVMEILMLSVSPRQLLAGKIIGREILGLLQAVAWVGTFLWIVGRQTLNVPAGFGFPAWILGWGIVFFLLGYAVYASLLAGLGALVPNLKETPQVKQVVFMPLLVAYFITLIIRPQDVHGALGTGLSLFPLTASIMMMKRLAMGGVPVWQLLLATGLLATTAYLIIRAVAAMFHAQNLLSGQRFSVKRYVNALLGRA
ncbi:MAG: ABC transporter permease [Candidatus Bipolaricaulia bacterium]